MLISKQDLASRLSKIKAAMPGRSSQFSSALQGILIKGNTATATSVDLSITAKLSAEAAEPFILPPKAIEMIDSLPGGEVDIQLCGGEVVISTGNIKNSFPRLDNSNFPEPKALKNISQNLKIDSKTLHGIVSSVLYATSVNDAKPITNGVYFEAKDGELNVVALDGYRSAWNRIEYEGDFKFIVPKITLEKLLRLGIASDIDISISGNSAVFASDDYSVYTRLLSGDYLDYRNVYPKHEYQITVNRKAFLESIGRILICVDDRIKSPTVMSIKDNKLTMKLQSSIADYSEEIDIDGPPKAEFKIGFNGFYLRDALKSYDAETVIMSFGGSLEGSVITDGGTLRSLVLPVRLKSEEAAA